MFDDVNWPTLIVSALAVVISAVVGISTTRANRASQREANQLTGTGQVFTQQTSLLQDIQEERDKWKADLKEEREQNKKDREADKKAIADLRREFDSFKESVKSQFSGYRAYIHGLRGQVHELGGVPIEWPADLDQ